MFLFTVFTKPKFLNIHINKWFVLTLFMFNLNIKNLVFQAVKGIGEVKVKGIKYSKYYYSY